MRNGRGRREWWDFLTTAPPARQSGLAHPPVAEKNTEARSESAGGERTANYANWEREWWGICHRGHGARVVEYLLF